MLVPILLLYECYLIMWLNLIASFATSCKLWDPTAQKVIIYKDIVCMEQPDGFVQDHIGRIVCKQKESLYGREVPRQLYRMFDSSLVSQVVSKSEYDRCVHDTFFILMLFVDDMFVASQSMAEISRLNA